MNHIIDSLSPIERKIIPHLHHSIDKIIEKSGLDRTTVLRALRFLETKDLVKLKEDKKIIVDIGINGIYYKKNHLPERKLLLLLEEKGKLHISEAAKVSKLTDNEFKAALGKLKNKALIDISNGNLVLKASGHEIAKKFPEEKLIESLPREKDSLSDEENFALDNLKERKDILELREEKTITFILTEAGNKIAGKEIKSDLLEEVTSEMIKSGVKGAKFRKYDMNSSVPGIYGGKRHFVNQSIDYAKKIWIELGFKEMSGSFVETSFWNFDALYTPQNHPAREIQDSFYLKSLSGKLPEKPIVEKVKESHEKGLSNSKGWGSSWEEKEAKKIVLRTHTTSLSARKLSTLKEKDLPAKFFAVGKVFRNETIDWSHGIEFYQTEGIVIDKNVNFGHLLGYLKKFYEKMGFKKIRFRPSYFPYTEPSVEIEVFHPEKNIWFELGGAGILRPEVTTALMGKPYPVLAWGLGLDRIIMDFYAIKDLRQMYANDLKFLREVKAWTK